MAIVYLLIGSCIVTIFIGLCAGVVIDMVQYNKKLTKIEKYFESVASIEHELGLFGHDTYSFWWPGMFVIGIDCPECQRLWDECNYIKARVDND